MADPNIDRTLTAGINLYYDLYRPSSAPAPLLIALHGYGANKRQMMREAQQMAPEGFAIASLQGFHQHLKEPREPGGPLRFGFGWLTNFHPEESVAIHHQALLDLTSRLIVDGVADSTRIFLLGFSQSCALNYRFAFTYPEKLRGVIGICGGIPGDWDTNSVYQSSPLSVFHLAEPETSSTHPNAYAIMNGSSRRERGMSLSKATTQRMTSSHRCARTYGNGC